MARYRASIDIQQPREGVFAYLSDFSTTREWDPGVVEAERLKGLRRQRARRRQCLCPDGARGADRARDLPRRLVFFGLSWVGSVRVSGHA